MPDCCRSQKPASCPLQSVAKVITAHSPPHIRNADAVIQIVGLNFYPVIFFRSLWIALHSERKKMTGGLVGSAKKGCESLRELFHSSIVAITK